MSQQQPNPYRTNPFGSQYGPLSTEFNNKVADAIAKEYPQPINQKDPYNLVSAAWTQGLGKMPTVNDVTINDSDFKGGRRRRRRTRKSRKSVRKSRKSVRKSRRLRKSRKSRK